MNRYNLHKPFPKRIYSPEPGDRVKVDMSKIDKGVKFVDKNTRGIILKQSSNGMEVEWDGEEGHTTYWPADWLLHE